MGKAVHYIALATGLIAAGATGAAAQDLRLTGIDLTATSGTLELHRVRAATAVLNSTSTQILTDELEFVANAGERGPLVARADYGFVAVDGTRPPSAEPLPRPSFDEILEYRRRFTQEATYGDVLLDGRDGQAEAKLGQESAILSKEIIWSEHYGRILIPEQFQQLSSMADGGQFKATGVGLSVDREFNQWTYFGDDENPCRLVIERGQAPQKTIEGTNSQ